MVDFLKKVVITIEFKDILNLHFEDIMKELSKNFLLVRPIPFKEHKVDITGPIAITNDFVIIYRPNAIILSSFGMTTIISLMNTYNTLKSVLERIFDLKKSVRKIIIDATLKAENLSENKIVSLIKTGSKVSIDQLLELQVLINGTRIIIFRDNVSDCYYTRIVKMEDYDETLNIMKVIQEGVNLVNMLVNSESGEVNV